MSNRKPVLGVGWDVGGWLGRKQAVAIVEQRGASRTWLGSPIAFKARQIEGTGPLGLIRLAWPVAPGDVLDRYRVVIAIDAPLGFPVAFQRLLRGEVPQGLNPSREIESPLAYRESERIIYRDHGQKKPLSAVFNKLGNNATVALTFARRWREEHGFRILPFDDALASTRTVIEVYPALAKAGGQARPGIAELLPSPLRKKTDEYDAAICAVLALAHAAEGTDPALPPLVGPPDDLSVIKEEGWIYSPASAWFATRPQSAAERASRSRSRS